MTVKEFVELAKRHSEWDDLPMTIYTARCWPDDVEIREQDIGVATDVFPYYPQEGGRSARTRHLSIRRM